MDSRQFQAIAKALADPQRFAMLERIARARGEVACMALVAELPITPATISHHIKELAAAGLIACRKSGKCGYFTAERAVMRAYQRELRGRLQVAPGKQAGRGRAARGRAGARRARA